MKASIVLIACWLCVTSASAQTESDTSWGAHQLAEVRIRAAFKNDTDRYHYNQMKYYVTIVLPYVNASTALFKEIQAKSEDQTVSKREYKRYVKSKEAEMRAHFEDRIKSLNVTQGVLLVKLIARQTDLNIYHMIREVKNPIVALKWQSWALVNGMNLDKKYHPEQEKDLENIMYDLGYPLPDSYATR